MTQKLRIENCWLVCNYRNRDAWWDILLSEKGNSKLARDVGRLSRGKPEIPTGRMRSSSVSGGFVRKSRIFDTKTDY